MGSHTSVAASTATRSPVKRTLPVWRAARMGGGDYIVGLVLYTGRQTLPFGPRLRAMPISALRQVVCGCAR